MAIIFTSTGETTNDTELLKFCDTDQKSEGPIYGSTNALTFVLILTDQSLEEDSSYLCQQVRK